MVILQTSRIYSKVTGKSMEDTRGDQCDARGTVLEPENLVEPTCAICGRPICFKESKHLYIAITDLEEKLRELVDNHPQWRKNAIVGPL